MDVQNKLDKPFRSLKLKFLTLSFLRSAVQSPSLLKEDTAWITHILPVLALAKPSTVSFKGLRELLEEDIELGEVADEIITTKHLRYIYTILRDVSRSNMLAKAMPQTKYTQYSAAVPVGMLAYKQAFGVPYSRWMLVPPSNAKETWMMEAMLGSGLSKILTVTEYLKHLDAVNVFDRDTMLDFRSAYDDNPSYTAIKSGQPKSPNPLHMGKVPLFYWCMLTQTWIFHPSVRHPDMITNLLDWDTPAEPLIEFTSLDTGGFSIEDAEIQQSIGFDL